MYLSFEDRIADFVVLRSRGQPKEGCVKRCITGGAVEWSLLQKHPPRADVEESAEEIQRITPEGSLLPA